MPTKKVKFKESSREILKEGNVVGITDKIYDINDDHIVFDEIIVRGDLSGKLTYNEKTIKITRVKEIIGLMVTMTGVKGPVWRGVECEVV